MGYKRLHTTLRMNKVKHRGTEKIGLIRFLCTSSGSLGQPAGIPEGRTCQWSPKDEDALMQKTPVLSLHHLQHMMGKTVSLLLQSFKAMSIRMRKVKPVAQKTQSYLTTELPSQWQKIFPIESSTPAPSSLEIKWLHFFYLFLLVLFFTKVNYMSTISIHKL